MLQQKISILTDRFKLIIDAKEDAMFFQRLIEYIPHSLNDTEIYGLLREAIIRRDDDSKLGNAITELRKLYLYSLEYKEFLKLIGTTLDTDINRHLVVYNNHLELELLLNKKLGQYEYTPFQRDPYQNYLEIVHFELLEQLKIQEAKGEGEEVLEYKNIKIFYSILKNTIRLEIDGYPVRNKKYRKDDLWILRELVRNKGRTVTKESLCIVARSPIGIDDIDQEEIWRTISRLKTITPLKGGISTDRRVGYQLLA